MSRKVHPRLLVLGASPLQAPAILKAKGLGFHVGAVDRDPRAFAAGMADEFFEVSTTDVDGALEVGRRFHPDGVVTLGTDMPMRAVAAISADLGLAGPSPSSIAAATDKEGMAGAFRAGRVPAPHFAADDDPVRLAAAVDGWDWPIILKPVDSSGSRGVVLLDSAGGWDAGFRYAQRFSRSGRVIAQEFLRGQEVSVEGFCVGADVHVVTITDKVTSGAPHFVELGHSQPTRHDSGVREAIVDVTVRAAAALGVTDCAVHAEIMVTSDGPRIIEFGARLGGDYITTELVPLSTGVDMVKALIQLASGEQPDLLSQLDRGSAIRFFSPGDFPSALDDAALAAAREVPGVVVAAVTGDAGNSTVRSSNDRLGHVIAEGVSPQQAVAACSAAIAAMSERTTTIQTDARDTRVG